VATGNHQFPLALPNFKAQAHPLRKKDRITSNCRRTPLMTASGDTRSPDS